MLLALDIGNTNVTIGAFDGDRLVASWRLATDAHRQADEYALQLNSLLPLKGVALGAVDEVVLCSVVPPLTAVFEELARSLFGADPLVVGAGTRTGVRILYDNPRDVGADRIADAVAAYTLYGGPVIVVDMGTATVFDAISGDGSYLGGAIAPGLNIAAESLFLSTSQLRRVEMTAPPTAIGKNTAHAIQSGLVFGYVGLIEEMVQRFKQEMNAPDARVIGTGGLATLLAGQTTVLNVIDEELTLSGLRLIHAMNRESSLTGSTSGGTE
jgi:type III pantothenate kinase